MHGKWSVQRIMRPAFWQEVVTNLAIIGIKLDAASVSGGVKSTMRGRRA